MPLSLHEKITILKKNVLQKYRPYIVLTTFYSIEELKHALKILESTMPSYDTNRSVRFGSNDRNKYSGDKLKVNSQNEQNRSRLDRFQNAQSNQSKDARNRSNSNASNHSNRAASPFRSERSQTPMYYRDRSGSNSRNNSQDRHRYGSNDNTKSRNLN